MLLTVSRIWVRQMSTALGAIGTTRLEGPSTAPSIWLPMVRRCFGAGPFFMRARPSIIGVTNQKRHVVMSRVGYRRCGRTGVVIIEDYLDAAEVAMINGQLQADLNLLAQEGELAGIRTCFSREYGVARIMQCDTNYPVTKAFFEDPKIKAIARAYVSADVISYLRMAELRREVGAISSADFPHFDDWRIRFKAFLLLNDINSDRAPFVYYKGSHEGRWRRESEYEYFRDGRQGRSGHFFLQEWEAITKLHKFEKLVCEGRAEFELNANCYSPNEAPFERATPGFVELDHD